MALLKELISTIIIKNPLQEAFLDKSVSQISDVDASALESYISYWLELGHDIDFLSDAYNLIVKDTLTEQIFFKRHGHYRYSSYEDVSAAVYNNNEYMSKYMAGLALTSFLWPNHSCLREYFADTIPKDKRGNYLEIGPGHGFYFMTAMNMTQYDFFYGIDISPTSVSMTNSILGSGRFGQFNNYEIRLGNFLEISHDKKYNCIVMGEVLEHVEEPKAFLQNISSLIESNGHIYISTCINSPACDHIFLFKSVEHLTELVTECKLRVTDQIILPYAGQTIEESERNKLPINIAMVLNR
ncbi:MAG: class I SAM-dependent methyltransferase [Desulfobacter sp.]